MDGLRVQNHVCCYYIITVADNVSGENPVMEVKWSPNHEDKFYTFGTNLALYKINDIPDDNSAWKEGGEYSRVAFEINFKVNTLSKHVLNFSGELCVGLH